VLLATAGGLGYLHPAPGTWASAAACAVGAAWMAVVPSPWTTLGMAFAALIATAIGWRCCGSAARHFGYQDPSQVVIDEVAGCWLALAILPPGQASAAPLWAAGIAFLSFRVFDIAKPWPLNWLERLPGSAGIMADDLAAGLLAGILTTAVLH
jgi:phosphatidylglycerophosphatase A